MGFTPNETFPDATDNGKVGGPDGTWGTGAQKTWTRKCVKLSGFWHIHAKTPRGIVDTE